MFALAVALSGSPALGERAALAPEAERAAAGITTAELRAHLEFLASDELQGRGTGHDGNRVAARYLASVFARIGLAPPDGRSFFQPVALYTAQPGPASSLVIVESRDGAEIATRIDPGETFQPALSAAATVTAGLVFAGFGLAAPEAGYDDYAGLDVTGRIVVALAGAPPDPVGPRLPQRRPGPLVKAAMAAERGAVGLVLVDRRRRDLRPLWRPQPSVRDRDFVLASEVEAHPIPVALVTEAAADRLLGPTPVAALAERLEAAVREAGGRPIRAPASMAIPNRRATLAVDLRAERIVAHNVIGIVQGADPSLANELVVVGAHFDHDGLDEAGRVYNGADDDGSGTAAVLEIAEAFAAAARAGARPRRTVVFALWNAEEKGLLGSRAFAEHPVPSGRVVVNVNLDMVGRNEDVPDERDPRFRGLKRTAPEANADAVHLIGYSYSPDLAAIVREENAAVGLRLQTTLDDNPQQLIRRSDHWTFLERRIPAALFTTGLHPDYHTTQDDVEKINFDKLEKIARLAYRVAWHVAAGGEPPRYVDPAPARRPSP